MDDETRTVLMKAGGGQDVMAVAEELMLSTGMSRTRVVEVLTRAIETEVVGPLQVSGP